jgi:hypothetical protein
MDASKQLTPKRPTLPRRALTSAEFSQLADVPPETEWLANIDNSHTRRAYRNDLKEFMTFAGIRTPAELRLITRPMLLPGARISTAGNWPRGRFGAKCRHYRPCMSS